jgi:hypothetical protein
VTQYFGGGFNSVQSRQANIHQNDVRPFQLADLYRFGPALGLGHYREIVAVPQDGLDAVPHDFVIVYQQDLRWHLR